MPTRIIAGDHWYAQTDDTRASSIDGQLTVRMLSHADPEGLCYLPSPLTSALALLSSSCCPTLLPPLPALPPLPFTHH